MRIGIDTMGRNTGEIVTHAGSEVSADKYQDHFLHLLQVL